MVLGMVLGTAHCSDMHIMLAVLSIAGPSKKADTQRTTADASMLLVALGDQAGSCCEHGNSGHPLPTYVILSMCWHAYCADLADARPNRQADTHSLPSARQQTAG